MLWSCAKEKQLTNDRPQINISAFVDINELIASGRGTGPTTPRQPVEVCELQCPGAKSSSNPIFRAREKMRRAHLLNLFSSRHEALSGGRSFFVGPKQAGTA